MKYIVNGRTRNQAQDAAFAFLDLPERMRHDIVREVLEWAGVTSSPLAGDAPIEWLVELLTCSDCGEDFILAALGRMEAAAKKTGKDTGTGGLFVRPEGDE